MFSQVFIVRILDIDMDAAAVGSDETDARTHPFPETVNILNTKIYPLGQCQSVTEQIKHGSLQIKGVTVSPDNFPIH